MPLLQHLFVSARLELSALQCSRQASVEHTTFLAAVHSNFAGTAQDCIRGGSIYSSPLSTRRLVGPLIFSSGAAGMASATRGRARTFADKKSIPESADPEIQVHPPYNPHKYNYVG